MLRLLVIMGSGETAPTMVKVHREVRDRLEADGVAEPTGVLLDTPFGFQVNADDLSERAVTYFAQSVGMRMEVAGARTAGDLQGERGDAVAARLARAPLVFSGPGSPTYALHTWKGTLVPGILAEKLALGGAVTFASAAALTLGSKTVPVYEIYKVGEAPVWHEGLDLLARLGLPAVVIPHYDNAEGGTHDTRFCYLGEERLRLLEGEIDEGEFVLGVDEHTALLIDLDEQVAEVAGNGGLTVRVAGRSSRLETGASIALADLVAMAATLRSGGRAGGSVAAAESTSAREPGPVPATTAATTVTAGFKPRGTPLLQAVRRYEADFSTARAATNVSGMVAAIVGLEDELWAWVADTNQSDELDRGRSALRAMVDELGQLAIVGARDPAEVVGPFVDLAVELRHAARLDRRFADSDRVRDALTALGVELHDTPGGSTWELSAGGETPA